MRKIISSFIKLYKNKLDLLDWNIDFEIRTDIDSSVYFDYNTKNALIVINKKDFKDLKKTILHELLHIKFPSYSEEDIEKESEFYL